MDKGQNKGMISEDHLVDLIKRAQVDSDMEAIESLYLLFVDRIYRYLMAYLRDEHTAEDVTAQVFVRLIERIDMFQIRPKDNVAIFISWLYRIAHNLMVDVLRADKRYRAAALEYAKSLAHDMSFGVLDWLDLERILQRLDMLNEQQRTVIILRFIEGLSIAETAQIMQRTEAAIKNLQKRALENLRRIL